MIYHFMCYDCAQSRFRDFCICRQAVYPLNENATVKPNYIESNSCGYPKQHWRLVMIDYSNGKTNEFAEEDQRVYEVKR